ncbi:MAG: AAA family ATPase [Patescibacteria group bacterium]
MHIQSLRITRYKSFKVSVTIPLSKNFNVLIGPNNGGKTNIIDAIDFLFNPEKKPARLHDPEADLELTLALGDEEQKRFTCTPSISVRGNEMSVHCFQNGTEEMGAAFRQYSAGKVKVLFYNDFSNFSQIQKDYRILQRTYPEAEVRFKSLLRQYFPEVHSVEKIVDVELLSQANVGTTRSVPIERMGSGFRRIFVILLYALHPDYPIVMIDEPEIHLHPALIKKLLKALMSQTTNQIIATSHSPLMIKASNLHEVYRVLKNEQGSHVYSMSIDHRSIDRKRLVQELNADNLEMFFADKVLVVEGVSDRILMRGLIDRFYTGTDEIKVIYTHGKSNIDVYIDLMSVFHIPYVVMLDLDALPALADQYHLQTDRIGARGQRGMIEALRERHIYVLDNGTIERNYPRAYQRKDSKPLSALYAAANITPQEYRSPSMRNLREIIEAL